MANSKENLPCFVMLCVDSVLEETANQTVVVFMRRMMVENTHYLQTKDEFSKLIVTWDELQPN